MEGKYGKLRPVQVERVDVAHPDTPWMERETVLPAKWEDDEPLFLLRSTDRLAPFIVQLYAMLAHLFGLREVGNGVQHQYWAIRKWQGEHPERVKLPD
jgi:hypothetical protein